MSPLQAEQTRERHGKETWSPRIWKAAERGGSQARLGRRPVIWRPTRALRGLETLHAAEELEDDNLTILDLENILLTGRIVERQKDRATRETKAVIQGWILDGREGETIVKINLSGVLYVVTVYLA